MFSLSVWLHFFIYIISRAYELIWCRRKPTTLKCLVGKTAIVTGGNTGIGYAVAEILASRGCKVIIADCQNAESSRDQIIATTGNKNVVYKHLDLSSLKSVRNFALDVCRTEEKIHILINNAGIGLTEKLVTEDGLNYMMQVNIFGAFLLTHLLLDPLKKAESAKIIFLSSMMAIFNDLSLDTLNVIDFEMNDKHRLLLYSNSKVCCIIIAEEFARRLQKYGITANSFDPIGAKTKIHENLKYYDGNWFPSILNFGLQISAREPAEISNCILHVISQNDWNTNGKNFVLSFIGRKPRVLEDKRLCENIWSKMEDLVDLKPEDRIKIG